jgi:hypothetical protein
MSPDVEHHSEICALLGKRVRVVLGQENGNAVISQGRLLGFGTDGTVEIYEDDCTVHFCWPMLDIEEVTT